LRILASRRFPGAAWNELRDVDYLVAPLGEAVRKPQEDVDALAVVGERVDAAALDAFPRLRVVANYGVGYDTIDVRACAARGIAVTNTPGVLTEATADLTFALLLAVRRRVVVGDRAVRERRWSGGWADPDYLGRDVAGTTLGIVGLGRIGKAVAQRAAGFGMRVIHASARGGVSLDELLERSDVVTLHCPLNPATRHLIDRTRLARMKRGAILINTARGSVVDEAALVAALEAGHLGGAGLDVFENEPAVHPGLMGRDDVVLLPHLGSATHETRARMATMALTDAARVLRGQRPLHPVNEVRSS
jgi:glyoxylate reductase